jgi:hypothetical protein
MMQTELLTKRNVAAIGEEITHELGAQFIKDYQTAHPHDVKAYVIGKDILTQILAQPGCEGIRFYNAINEMGQKTLVYVGLNANGSPLQYSTINNEGQLQVVNSLVADRARQEPNDTGFDESDWFWCV